jgi:hypothetical protein
MSKQFPQLMKLSKNISTICFNLQLASMVVTLDAMSECRQIRLLIAKFHWKTGYNKLNGKAPIKIFLINEC